jgi:hypothetical protein
MERSMISQITPLVSFVDLKHNAIGTQGNVISLKRNVFERVRLLPHKPNDTDTVYVRFPGLTGKV